MSVNEPDVTAMPWSQQFMMGLGEWYAPNRVHGDPAHGDPVHISDLFFRYPDGRGGMHSSALSESVLMITTGKAPIAGFAFLLPLFIIGYLILRGIKSIV